MRVGELDLADQAHGSQLQRIVHGAVHLREVSSSLQAGGVESIVGGATTTMSDPHPYPKADYGRNINSPDVLIIGAGISGTCGYIFYILLFSFFPFSLSTPLNLLFCGDRAKPQLPEKTCNALCTLTPNCPSCRTLHRHRSHQTQSWLQLRHRGEGQPSRWNVE